MADHKFPMAVGDFGVDVASGLVVGSWSVVGHGSRGPILSGVTEDIWANPAPTPLVRLSSAERMSIVSTDIDDDDGGTGAEYITIFGVDNDWNVQTEKVVLNGTTPVLTIGTYLRVNLVVCGTDNNALTNQGTITVTAEVAATVQDVVAPLHGYSGSTHYAVPNGHRAMLQNIAGDGNRNDDILFKLEVSIPNVTGLGYAAILEVPAPTSISPVLLGIPEKSDIKFTAQAVTNNVTAHLYYQMLILAN